MKLKLKLAIILILGNFTFMGAYAQTRGSNQVNSSLNDTANVPKTYIDTVKVYKIHSMVVTASWYHPELGFFNDVFLPYCQVTDQFGPNYSIGANVSYTLPYEFRTRLGISYWKDKVEGTATSRINSLEIGFTRYKLGLLYTPYKLNVKNFQLYAGIDGQFFIIKHNINQNNTSEILKGSDYVYSPFAGLEYSKKHFIAGLEFAYNLGDYYQSFCECQGYTRQKVSIDGPEISLSLGYKF